MSCETSHFDTVYAVLPSSLKSAIDDLLSTATRESAARHTLDQLVRFALSKESDDDDLDSVEEWNTQRQKVEKAFSNLSSMSKKGKKRAREEDATVTSDSDPKTKKLKLGSDGVGDADEPIFSLHSVSATSPIRKKVHITVHQKSIRLTHPTSGAQEASVPLTSLTRGFLISTPGKSKPHWTVIILTDVEQNQIIFGLDAVPPSFITTTHPAPLHNNPKGTEAKPALIQFFFHLSSHITLQEPSTSVFRSAAGEPFIDTYLRAKDGHLFFFKDGILFGEKKPCMWIGMEVIDSVRSLSATGRTFSLFVRRVGEVMEEDEEKEGGEETEFSLIDGKNQDSVAQWVRENRPRFGVSQRPINVTQDGIEADELTTNEDTPEERKAGEDSEDMDDSDFESGSESDGGSESSDSSNSGDSGREDDEGQSGSDDDVDAEEETEGVSLDPSKHPLLREGAVPRMSRETLDAVVGMVEKDLMKGLVKRAQPGSAYDDEDVDELED